MYSSTLSLTSNNNIKQNIPLSFHPCQLLRVIFLPSTKSTAVVVIIFMCVCWVLGSDLNLLHEPSIRKHKGTNFWSGGTTSGISFIIRMLMDTNTQKYYANVISPNACWVKCLSYLHSVICFVPLLLSREVVCSGYWRYSIVFTFLL